jgi:replicative DNA helicase
MIFEVTSKKIETRFSPLREIIKNSIETIDSLYQRKENITGIGTGFRDMDIKTAGLMRNTALMTVRS